MLKGIPDILSPALLKTLCEMGHGDEIVLADANFPAESVSNHVIRADGIGGEALLAAILQLMPLDQYDSNHFILMEKCGNDPVETAIWDSYLQIVRRTNPGTTPSFLSRFDFYERTKHAYAVLATGEKRQYANIILKKGCMIS